MTKEEFKRAVKAQLPDSSSGDYKDLAATICRVAQEVAWIENCGNLIRDMPDGLNCPRAFLDWWSSL